MRDQDMDQLLRRSLSKVEQQLFEHLILKTQKEFTRWYKEQAQPWQNQLIARFFSALINEQKRKITGLQMLADEFGQRMAGTETESERQEHILDFARRLGADDKKLQADRRAFKRWFGFDAVLERCQRQIDEIQYYLSFLLPCFGSIMANLLSAEPDLEKKSVLWSQIDPESSVRIFFNFQGDERVTIAAFKGLSLGLAALPAQIRTGLIDQTSLSFITRSALEVSKPVWLQCEALQLLARMEIVGLEKVLHTRLKNPQSGDDFFVRRRCLLLIAAYKKHFSNINALLQAASQDENIYVRQTLAQVLGSIILESNNNWRQFFSSLEELVLADRSEKVRAQAVLSLSDLLGLWKEEQNIIFAKSASLLAKSLEQEKNSFVLRTALRSSVQGLDCLPATAAQDLYTYLQPSLTKLHTQFPDLKVRRWAAMTEQRFWVHLNPGLQKLHFLLAKKLAEIRPGKSLKIRFGKSSLPPAKDLGQVLSVLAQDDFGLAASRIWRGWKIYKGDRFGLRLWRVWHEFFHPSPDKRQAHKHSIGRINKAPVLAPSSVLAELTKTKVPGEPLLVSEEDGWRPYLPLVDEALSCLKDKQKNTLIFSPEGVTELSCSTWLPKRLWNILRVSIRFSYLANLRNWDASSGLKPNSYCLALSRLGVKTKFKPHTSEDKSVSRFFVFGLPLGPELWERFSSYFFSVYQNSIYELGIFSAALAGFFATRTIVLSRKIMRSRKKLTLVVGGWGTRGKSGVERLKAGLFEALGHAMISKTTGCEAMFLYSHAFGKTREMFLFRPYDKATIWEQADLMHLAVKLKGRVFLWECMALTPSYVRILQEHWARDNIATITNTYPDHEDIQGPAGYNIPLVMNEFIPHQSTLVATEEQMLPILRQGAKEKNTELISADWLEAGLLAPEILARFPYEEHPYNIALVALLAGKLGLEEDVALKEMADRVVPDIGVLKAFPPSYVQGRKLEFVNGMSANERFATLSNWERMGFARQDINGRDFLVCLVNNRADRISRSRMFASILVQDVACDNILLIGSNLKGMQGYIIESLQDMLGSVSLDPDKNQEKNTQKILRSLQHKLRLPDKEQELGKILDSILQHFGLSVQDYPVDQPDRLREKLNKSRLEPEQIEEIVAFYKPRYEFSQRWEQLEQELPKGDWPALDKKLHSLVRDWFAFKVCTVDDAHASGEHIISALLALSPPGSRVRIMGMQNIKGPGLDFVYRWQAWERCELALRELESEDKNSMEKALKTLMGFQELGSLSQHGVELAVQTVRVKKYAQNESIQAGLSLLLSNQEQALKALQKDMQGQRKPGVLEKILNIIEAFLDAGDAVSRRKQANLIYKDMIAQRISTERAALELKNINKRQKGGWLKARILY